MTAPLAALTTMIPHSKELEERGRALWGEMKGGGGEREE